MKRSLVMAGLFLGVVAAATAATAQNYPWCALYDKGGNDVVCSFDTREQCMASVSGIGGFCMANNTYTSPAAAPRPRHKPHKAS